MDDMVVVKDRRQGCWAHPALFEVGRTVGPCGEMVRSHALGPCPTRSYKTRETWCEQCVAHASLEELAKILRSTLEHSKCECPGCRELGEFLGNGAENQKRFGI